MPRLDAPGALHHNYGTGHRTDKHISRRSNIRIRVAVGHTEERGAGSKGLRIQSEMKKMHAVKEI